MNEGKNLHAGHRERMIGKLLEHPDALAEHELLEVLLFSLIPRKDTNALAHKLLKTFGSLENVFKAPADSLKLIDGVGESVAAKILVIGKIISRVSKEKEPIRILTNFENVKKVLVEIFRNSNSESFVMLLLDKRYKLLAAVKFSDENKHSVSVDIPELISAFSVHKPAMAIIAHNHTSGSVLPSEEDMFTTTKFNVLCQLHGIRLVDHVIVSGEKAYSFEREGDFYEIIKNADLNALFKKIKEN